MRSFSRLLTLACFAFVAHERASAFLARLSALLGPSGAFRFVVDDNFQRRSLFLTTPCCLRPTPRLYANRGKGDGEMERGDYLAHSRKRTDVRLFLTQRSIQSFIHLLLETRDPHTVRWIEVMNSAKGLRID
jgi:hypothetical protein